MLNIVTIPIILNAGQSFFYYLLLMVKIQNRIDRLFNLKVKLKLVNNGDKLKYNIKYNMFSFNRFYDYALRCLYERSERRLARREMIQERRNEIRTDVKNNIERLNDLENEKKLLALGNIRCQNQKCKLYTNPQVLLETIRQRLRQKMETMGFNLDELTEAEKLVMHSKSELEWEKYEDVLKCVELNCKGCGHELMADTPLTPKYIIYLQKKRKSSLFVE